MIQEPTLKALMSAVEDSKYSKEITPVKPTSINNAVQEISQDLLLAVPIDADGTPAEIKYRVGHGENAEKAYLYEQNHINYELRCGDEVLSRIRLHGVHIFWPQALIEVIKESIDIHPSEEHRVELYQGAREYTVKTVPLN